jgi:hypothetical protein
MDDIKNENLNTKADDKSSQIAYETRGFREAATFILILYSIKTMQKLCVMNIRK